MNPDQNEEGKGEQKKYPAEWVAVLASKQMCAFIAEKILGNSDQRDSVTDEHIALFMQRYPEERLLTTDINEFLERVPEAKRSEYNRRLRWDMIGLLYRTPAVNTAETLQLQPTYEKLGEYDVRVERIDPKEANEILEWAQIHGDDGYNGKKLTTDILRQEGLGPEYKVTMEKMTMWFSSTPYDLGHGRTAVVAYVEKRGKVTARSFYSSASSGVMRYMPDYLAVDGELSFYGKGYGEESVTLPIVMQKALAEIMNQTEARAIPDPHFIFTGTARNMASNQEQRTYLREVESAPRTLSGKYYDKQKPPPEQILLSANESPDFSKLLTNWKRKTELYGEVTTEVFSSKDGKYRYMFCQSADGKTWIGGIENDSEIQSTGLKQTWVDPGHLGTPGMEYLSGGYDQTGGYGDPSERKGSYVSMSGYTSKIPVIKEYIENKKLRMELFMGARSWEDLYQLIRQAGTIKDSNGVLSAEEQIEQIDRVRKEELKLANITNTGRLRETVFRILRDELLAIAKNKKLV